MDGWKSEQAITCDFFGKAIWWELLIFFQFLFILVFLSTLNRRKLRQELKEDFLNNNMHKIDKNPNLSQKLLGFE